MNVIEANDLIPAHVTGTDRDEAAQALFWMVNHTRFATKQASRALALLGKGNRLAAGDAIDNYNGATSNLMAYHELLWKVIGEDQMPETIFDACCQAEETMNLAGRLTNAWNQGR